MKKILKLGCFSAIGLLFIAVLFVAAMASAGNPTGAPGVMQNATMEPDQVQAQNVEVALPTVTPTPQATPTPTPTPTNVGFVPSTEEQAYAEEVAGLFATYEEPFRTLGEQMAAMGNDPMLLMDDDWIVLTHALA